ncbi:MAG: nucleoside triphosphate pyrophosphohydrolase [Nitriliruptoraceae bacterium]
MSDPSVRVALVETSEVLPGLLPFQAWDVLATAEVVLLRDAERHPSAPSLYYAGLDLESLAPAALDRGDLDLTRPGGPEHRRMAKALVQRAREAGDAVYLLGPEDEGLAPALAGMAAQNGVEIELVFLAQQPEGTELLRLVEVMQRLRDPDDGCPWDREQDHHTLLRHLVEETYELVEAVEQGDDDDVVEELGDVLLQVVFHARIAAERRAFGIDDVARGIADKLVRRHPHVFGDGDAATADEVQANWDQLKAVEKGRDGPFDGVPSAGPGLDLLDTLQRKAAKRGVDPDDLDTATARVRTELEALLSADDDAREDGVGELIAAVVATARHLEVDPEAAARRAARRFRARVEALLAEAERDGVEVSGLDADELLTRWRQRGTDEA